MSSNKRSSNKNNKKKKQQQQPSHRGSPDFVQSMRDGAQGLLDAHRTAISQNATARQLLPLEEQREQILEGLMKYGTDCELNAARAMDDGDQTPIATMEGREFARNLWSTGAEMGAMLSNPDDGFSVFKMLCIQGNAFQVERMLKAADSSSRNNGKPSFELAHILEYRESSLRLSALLAIQSIGKNMNELPGLRKGQEDCARLLLKYGARPDARDVVGKTVIHYGAGKMANPTSLKISDMCIRAYQSCHFFGKQVELHGLSNEAMNGLRGIGRGFVEENNRRAVYLLDKKKEVAVKPENIRLIVVDNNNSPSNGDESSNQKTPLVDIQDRLGSVALHELVMSNRADVAKFLLMEHGASYDIVELDAGCTPWKMATINTCLTSVCPVVVQAGVQRGRQKNKEAAKQCRHCHQTESRDVQLQVCSKCKVAQYCSRDCQVAAWKAGHNKECKQLQREQTEGIRLEGTTFKLPGVEQQGDVPTLASARTGKTTKVGKYQRPKGVKVDERFYVKIQNASGNSPLLVYDKTRSCCFYIQQHQTGFYEPLKAKVLAQTATQGLKSYFQASFDSDDVCTIYPGTSTLKNW